MVDDESTRNCHEETRTMNGVLPEIENGTFDGNSAGSSGEGLQTYKRRKRTKTDSLDARLHVDGRDVTDSASQLADKLLLFGYIDVIQQFQLPILKVSSEDRIARLTLPKSEARDFTNCQFPDTSGLASNEVSLPMMGSRASINGLDNHSLKHWRTVALEQMYQSVGEGGLKECIRDALFFNPESSCTTTVNESAHLDAETQKCPLHVGCMLNGTQNATKEHMCVVSNGSLNGSYHRTRTERAFFDILISEKFSELCDLLFEKFQGMKVDSIFNVSLMNSRMKDGAYESIPMLFESDIQQACLVISEVDNFKAVRGLCVWTKLQKVGSETVALAKSLSDISRLSHHQKVKNNRLPTLKFLFFHFSVNSLLGFDSSILSMFVTQESDVHAKSEQTEACGVYRVCSCRRCGEKADVRDCLVCDLCEEMYHVSCIEPAVEEIPLKSWYCSNCTAKGIESLHENCAVCERLSGPHFSSNGVDGFLTDEETLVELEESSNGLEEDGLQLSKGCKKLPHCNICKNDVETSEEYRICGHSFCPHKYYHVSCLTRKQLVSYGLCWYCPSCLCRACLVDRDDDKIVLCDGCDQAYHIYCMQPPRSSIPRGKWFCRKCDSGIQRIRKAKRAHESLQNKLTKRTEEGKGALANLKHVQDGIGKEVLDKSGGVDMLLTAAKTLNFQEEAMAAMRMKN
ncbi:hypothetical protein RJ639_004901 [Escallonia herrerae]|uniref:Uncharacterized protein n=1 Tax=Escallonia herrerae TaxID=1293975 RepID=A0AA88W481_9ASTE|nr:hypothetical protein RJ639_004901 [Escallonia herrerae]